MMFAEIDPNLLTGGAAALVLAVGAALGGLFKSKREADQSKRIDALAEWQKIHEQDRAEILSLKAELIDLRRRLDAAEAKANRMTGHILYLERLLQSAGVKVETWHEIEAGAKQ